MPKSINTSPQALLVVPGEVLRDLADVALVPPEQREFFFESVCINVQTACELDRLAKQELAIKKGASLLRAALTLYEVIGNLNNNEREFMEAIWARGISDRISSGSMVGLWETAYRLAELFSLMTGKSPPGYPHQAPQKRKRGKRPGDVKNWIFQNFVFDLLTSTAVAGGKLPHDKNRPGRPLVKAIRMLEPHLPDGVLPKRPKRLPRSTLQRILTRYNQIKADLDDLEND
jgi:hypothetical protein